MGMHTSPHVGQADGPNPDAQTLERLDALDAVDHDGPTSVIDAILALLAESLDVALTVLLRVEGEVLHIARSYDRGGMGLRSGDLIPLCDTY